METHGLCVEVSVRSFTVDVVASVCLFAVSVVGVLWSFVMDVVGNVWTFTVDELTLSLDQPFYRHSVTG